VAKATGAEAARKHTDVDLAAFDDGRPIATRTLLGGRNGMFFVPDALSATDANERFVIADRTFVERYAIRTVFGMAGAYLDGTLALIIVFSTALIPRLTVDRFPSLISNFKMATSRLIEEGRIFSAPKDPPSPRSSPHDRDLRSPRPRLPALADRSAVLRTHAVDRDDRG
jgi:hypothetical protein